VTDAGTTLVARYELTAPLGGELAAAPAWAATDRVLAREVRVTLPEGEHVAATLDAARRAALVIDPRLARVLDVGVERLSAPTDRARDLPYVVTEPYTGISLTELAARGPVDAQQARAVVGEAASALESARRRGLHHEALRPEAVRLVASRVLVTGLGIDGPVSGLGRGTGDEASRADAVGLVSLLYYLLTTRWPTAELDADWLADASPRPLPAPRSGSGPAPVGDLARGVPADLASLCAATLSGGSDGPRTPGEVVAALEPWGPVELPRPVERTSVLHPDGPTAPAPHDAPATPATVTPPTRTPVFGSGVGAGAAVGASAAGAAATVLGSPPVDPRWGLAGAGAASSPGTAAGYAAGTTNGAAGPGGPGSGGPGSGGPGSGGPGWGGAADGSGNRLPRSTAELDRHTFNPTRYVLIFFLVAVVVVTGTAVVGLAHNFRPAFVYSGAQPTFGSSTAPAQRSTPGSTAAPTQAPEDVRPVIAKGAQVDPPPQGDENEHPEAVDRAFDGDLDTYWYSRTYNTPQFSGLKPGIGYAITLKQAASVSTVILDTNNKGGHVEIRATTAGSPTSGDVLASGSLSSETTLSFDHPVTSKTFVLWFTELPTNPDGKFRIELNEIQVS
jgi:hypothetical protein